MRNTGSTPAGWHHAPGDPERTQRYWDGSQWVGEPHELPRRASVDTDEEPPLDTEIAPGFVKALLDTSFSQLITPSVVRVYFVAGLVVIALVAVIVFVSFASRGGASLLLGVVVVPAVAFVYLLGLRLFCEFLIVLFRIENNTRRRD